MCMSDKYTEQIWSKHTVYSLLSLYSCSTIKKKREGKIKTSKRFLFEQRLQKRWNPMTFWAFFGSWYFRLNELKGIFVNNLDITAETENMFWKLSGNFPKMKESIYGPRRCYQSSSHSSGFQWHPNLSLLLHRAAEEPLHSCTDTQISPICSLCPF